MWTRKLLKSNARSVLERRGGIMLLAALIFEILCNLSVTADMNVKMSNRAREILDLKGSVLSLGGLFNIPVGRVAAGLMGVVCALIMLFVVTVLYVGYARFLMESRQGNAPISTMFSAFYGRSYVNTWIVRTVTDIKIFLWSLLFLVPGIVKAYEYRMVPWLLAENPYLSIRRANELSRKMTDGEKMNIFKLDLSFFGWILLAALVEGIISGLLGLVNLTWLDIGFLAMVVVSAYRYSTYAELYAALRAKLNAMGVLEEGELAGFVTYE